MALIDWFIQGEHSAEDELMKPMPGEDQDLPTHVEVCARRYKSLKDSILHGHRGQKWLFILLGILALIVLFEDKFWALFN